MAATEQNVTISRNIPNLT